jgi:hypothetical protein
VELFGIKLLLIGLALVVLGYLWLLIRAFKVRVFWGLALFFPPFALFFLVRHFRRSLAPLVVMLLGLVVGATPFGIVYYYAHYVPLGPREKIVEGERHLTLTGWDRSDYILLLSRPDTVVLQMANPDVTDDTLLYLRDMKQLRELDLANTQVSDAGLKVLGELPELQKVLLSKTRVTQAGFRERVLPLDGLKEIHVRGLKIPRSLLVEWKKKQPGRRYWD